MTGNSFGHRFVVTSFGESHGVALGVVIDGCPAGLKFDEAFLLAELKRRRPGQEGTPQQEIVTQRSETDLPEILSGVFQGLTLGTPLAMLVRNGNQRSIDYDDISKKNRRGHADDVWKSKFLHVDHRGGGRSSGRETVSRVMAGAVAKMLLLQVSPATKIISFATQIGPLQLSQEEEQKFLSAKNSVDDFIARFPGTNQEVVKNLLLEARKTGQSYGGLAKVVIQAPPANLGQPVFHKLKADLTSALMGIGAVVGVELGEGFSSAGQYGTDFHQGDTSVYGGIRGGISTGECISLKVAFKPTSSILNVSKKGRHDPCIVTRAIPVLESMVALVLVDHLLWSRQDRISSSL